MMKNKYKKMGLIILSVVIIVAASGVTYATLIDGNLFMDDTGFTVPEDANFTCVLRDYEPINGDMVQLQPTSCDNSQYVLKRKIEFTVETNEDVILDLFLNINEISKDLSNSSNFKYHLTAGDGGCYDDVVAMGGFTGQGAGSQMNLLFENIISNTLNETYYLYIWLDDIKMSTDGLDLSFDFDISGTCVAKPNMSVVS